MKVQRMKSRSEGRQGGWVLIFSQTLRVCEKIKHGRFFSKTRRPDSPLERSDEGSAHEIPFRRKTRRLGFDFFTNSQWRSSATSHPRHSVVPSRRHPVTALAPYPSRATMIAACG